MVRTQLQLTPEQAQAVKRVAAERGVSMAEVIRQSIDAFVSQTERPSPEEARRRALQIIGIIRDGPRDFSERHDDYLAEAFES